MLTGRGTLFGPAFFVAPKAQGMVSWRILPFALRPRFPFLSHIFFDGWKQTERRGSRVKAARLLRVHRSAAQSLDPAPALGILSSEKMGDHPPLFSNE